KGQTARSFTGLIKETSKSSKIFLDDMRVNSSRKLVWFIRLIVLLVLPAAAASVATAERLPIKTYTIADGLPSDSINRIVLDSHGFLWFCTPEGLSRFDGYRFTNYGIDQGLPTRIVSDLLETRSGDYLVATGNGVCRFIPDASGQSKFETYRLDED